MESTVIILAGGKSSRMGTNKALLSLNGKTNIEIQVEEALKITPHILIVTNHFEDYAFLDLPMVEDKRKDWGPLAGLEAGLEASTTEKNLMVACDMPFFQAGTAKEIILQLAEYEAVVPEIEGRLHPLFAAYRKSTLPLLQETLMNDTRRVVTFLERLNTKRMKRQEFTTGDQNGFERIFFNMNNPEEYAEAKLLSGEKVY